MPRGIADTDETHPKRIDKKSTLYPSHGTLRPGCWSAPWRRHKRTDPFPERQRDAALRSIGVLKGCLEPGSSSRGPQENPSSCPSLQPSRFADSLSISQTARRQPRLGPKRLRPSRLGASIRAGSTPMIKRLHERQRVSRLLVLAHISQFPKRLFQFIGKGSFLFGLALMLLGKQQEFPTGFLHGPLHVRR